MSDRVEIMCDGVQSVVDVPEGASLLTVLREQLGVISVKDGCAPQGQCGCCTVLVDGEPRVACVTPATRAVGRNVTTIGGLDPAIRDALIDAFVACGGSQCGFCTPGIIVRVAALIEHERTARVDIDRALAAHLCRCTGWKPIVDSITRASGAGAATVTSARRIGEAHADATVRADLEGGVAQRVDRDVPFGAAGFADDTAPRDALVAVPRPPGSSAPVVEAVGLEWVVAESLDEARRIAGKVQGRRTTRDDGPPLAPPVAPPGGVALATQWVEPAYLEPDASWCEPGGEPATPLANGGAFGGKLTSRAPEAARALADSTGRAVRVVYSREDTVRLGPKRPPIAATARYEGGKVVIAGRVVRAEFPSVGLPCAYSIAVDADWETVDAPGPPVSTDLRAFGLAEQALLVEGALTEAGVDRAAIVSDAAGRVLLDCAVKARSGACAGARVHIDSDGLLAGVDVRITAGDPLDEVVLHSYALGAVHMALGWMLSEGLAVDRETGEVLGLTIRSFGIIRARDLPPVTVTVVDDPGPPLARASDAAFAAVAAATWNAITVAEGVRPTVFPATATRAAKSLRRALSGTV